MKKAPDQATFPGGLRVKPFWLRLLLLLAAVIAWCVFVSMVFKGSRHTIAETHHTPPFLAHGFYFITMATPLFFTRN